MKTQMKNSNLKKMAITALASLVLSTGSFTQSGKGFTDSKNDAALVRLESFMSRTEQSLRYIAPATAATEDVSAEIASLDEFVDNTINSLKYEATAYSENNETLMALESLDKFTASNEEALKYRAPSTDDFSAIAPEMQSLDDFNAKMEASLKYKAPAEITDSRENAVNNLHEERNGRDD